MSGNSRPSLLARWLADDSVKRVFQNGLTLLKGKAAAGVVALSYMSLAAHALGPERFGILIIINVYTLAVGELFVFSGWHAVIRYGTECLAEGRLGDLQKLVGFASLVELGSGLLAAVAASAFVPVVGPLLGVPSDMLPIAAIYGLSVLAVARATPSAILYLFERFGTLSMQQPLVALARLFGAGMAYLTDAGLPGFIAAWMFAHLVDAGFHWAFAIREVHSRGLLRGIFKWPRGVTQEHKGLWSFSIATKLDRSVGQLGGRVAPLAVGFVLEPGAVALYHVALRLGMLLASPTMVLTRTIYPELANLAATADLRAILRVTLRTGAIAGVAVSPVLLLFVVFGDAILEAIGGAGFGEAHVTLVMIASAQVIALLALPLNAALQAIGRPGDALRVNAVATVSLIPVLFGFLWWVGLVGTGLHAIAISVAKLGGLGMGLFGVRGEASKEPAS